LTAPVLTTDVPDNTFENAVEKCRVVPTSFGMLIRLSKATFPRQYVVHSAFLLLEGRLVTSVLVSRIKRRKSTEDIVKRI
jgi:hypothetical protein